MGHGTEEDVKMVHGVSSQGYCVWGEQGQHTSILYLDFEWSTVISVLHVHPYSVIL